jgi:hypothetical protein
MSAFLVRINALKTAIAVRASSLLILSYCISWVCPLREQEEIALALMVPFRMIMSDVLVQRPA